MSLPTLRAPALNPEFRPRTAASWGGKGLGLRLLAKSGIAVPRTAALPSDQVAAMTAMLPSHGEALAAWRRYAEQGVEAHRCLRLLRDEILALAPDPSWERIWMRTQGRLGAKGAIIVRSSASIEDSGESSFAGAYLSVVVEQPTASKVFRAILEVVASLYADEAAKRVLDAGIDPADVRMAVVIQPVVAAKVAGVALSRPPQSPWSSPSLNSGYVEWTDGPGAGVVQGLVETKAHALGGVAPGREVAPFWGQLSALARRGERLLGAPADLEWAYDGRTLWALQLRPLADETSRLAARIGTGRVMSRALTLERFPEPLSPFAWSVLRRLLTFNVRALAEVLGLKVAKPEDIAVLYQGYMYSDDRFFAFPARVRLRFRAMVRRHYALPLTLAKAAWWAIAAAGVRWRFGAALFSAAATEALLNREAAVLSAGWRDHCEGHLAKLLAWNEEVFPTEGAQGAAETLRARMHALAAISEPFHAPDLAIYLIKESAYKALARVWTASSRDERNLLTLISQLQGSFTGDVVRRLQDFAAALSLDESRKEFLQRLERANGLSEVRSASLGLAQSTAELWQSFLRDFGHLSASWDPILPTWAESSTTLLAMIRPYLDAPARSAALPCGDSSSFATLFAQSIGPVGPDLGGSIGILAHRFRDFMLMDEEQHFTSGRFLAATRRIMAVIGQHLCGVGMVAAAEDVFFLTFDELDRALGGSPYFLGLLVERRRRTFVLTHTTEAPWTLPPKVEVDAVQMREEGGISCTGMSPGVAEGPLVILRDRDAYPNIAPGAVLLTTSPNPTLAPLFPKLAALVTATGGPLSHGFIAAREYGLAAVSGVGRDAWQWPEGSRVRVDGTRGTIKLLAPLLAAAESTPA